MIEMTGAFDLWTLFVVYVFGNFWIAVLALTLVLYIIMGLFGRISIYTVTWICTMFILSMALGYGFVLITMLISIIVFVYVYFAGKGTLDRGGT